MTMFFDVQICSSGQNWMKFLHIQMWSTKKSQTNWFHYFYWCWINLNVEKHVIEWDDYSRWCHVFLSLSYSSVYTRVEKENAQMNEKIFTWFDLVIFVDWPKVTCSSSSYICWQCYFSLALLFNRFSRTHKEKSFFSNSMEFLFFISMDLKFDDNSFLSCEILQVTFCLSELDVDIVWPHFSVLIFLEVYCLSVYSHFLLMVILSSIDSSQYNTQTFLLWEEIKSISFLSFITIYL